MAPEHVKGYIYVEAFKQSHVKAAIDGISNLRMGMYAQQMVPIKEMTDVLRVVKEQTGLKKGQWIRIKRGLYKDDLAQVVQVDLASNQVYLKLLPRIDYSRKRGALRSGERRRCRPDEKSIINITFKATMITKRRTSLRDLHASCLNQKRLEALEEKYQQMETIRYLRAISTAGRDSCTRPLS